MCMDELYLHLNSTKHVETIIVNLLNKATKVEVANKHVLEVVTDCSQPKCPY